MKPMTSNNQKNDGLTGKLRKWPVFFLAVPLLFYFIFGAIHLTKFETADEHYWMYSNYNNNNYWANNDGRIHQYWEALLSGDWKRTRINDKPGITVAYVSGIGSWLKTNLDKNIERGVVPAMTKSDKAQKINFFFRLPLLIFNGLFSILLFYLIRKLARSNWIAIIAIAFILLSPVIVGISQIVNPDALLWEFGFAAFLSYLIYIREGGRKFAISSAVFLGLSLLTKYSSVIFLPFFLAVMFFYIIENIERWPKDKIAARIRKLSLSYFFIIAGALAIYAVILPDNLVEFRHFMKGSLGFKGMQMFFWALFGLDLLLFLDVYFLKSAYSGWIFKKLGQFKNGFKKLVIGIFPVIFLIILLNSAFGADWLKLFTIPFDSASKSIFSNLSAGKYLRIALVQFLPLVFSLTPLVILSVLYAWIKNLKTNSEFQWIIFIFSFFMLIFAAASFQQELILTNRYSILLYPLVLTMAAIGIFQFFSLAKKKLLLKFGILAAVVIVGLFSLWKAMPFYFNYMNFLLPDKYLISDAWGYGGFEAAEYLNNLPDAQQLHVWSDYNGVCVFFNGQCEANYLTMVNIRKKSAPELPHYDYFVGTRRGNILSKKIWDTLRAEYQSEEIWNLNINSHPENFIKIYENEIYKDEG
jgi:4-amino-4-deoxy-L-arabinose transferase-like glycosyltransferase